ncbi:MAG: hypothetical protein P4L87_12720 [Formivibrio sp.]|nr:hypothetical protein [Formivibrio sp.]
MRSNYLSAGFSINTAYDDNVLLGGTAKPVGDVTYSLGSTLKFDQTTPRMHNMFAYNPGFTLYQKTSALNAVNQNALLGFQYRLTPHIAINVQDTFIQSSNVFNQPLLLSGTGVSGGTQPSQAAVIAPFVATLQDSANAQASYQYSAMGMIGAGGTFSKQDYPNSSPSSGLSNSNSSGGSVFLNRRLPGTQYVGATYSYSSMSASLTGMQSGTQVHTLNGFYTIYLQQTLSFSISSGPQYFVTSQSPFPSLASWAPAVTASMGWQRNHTNLAVSYSKTVSGAGGLLGTFDSTLANASASWRFGRTWTLGSGASYMISKSVTPAFFQSSPGGHSISGTASVQHPIGEHFTMEFGYARLHQSYSEISVISDNPDSDSVHISFSYHFSRPIGR